ncbi:MAG: hypothetical protein AAF297_10250 [Planctomycetota bacterium]
MKQILSIALVGAVAAAAGAQSDPVVLSFTYSDLNGSFDVGSGMFNAVADSSTSGDVTRLDGASDLTAQFDSGFVNLANDADAVFDIQVSNITTGPMGPTADGSGSFELTDIDGDTVAGDIDGHWTVGSFGNIFFTGDLTGVSVTDNSGDGEFEGSTAGAFSTSFIQQPSVGAVIVLSFSPTTFFTQDFSDISTLISGRLVPTPGASIILASAGLIAVRRRR